jgi:hypothetical protein
MEPTVRNPRIEPTIGFRSWSKRRVSAEDSPSAGLGQFRLEIQAAGTEFLDAETGSQGSTRETVNIGRDRER